MQYLCICIICVIAICIVLNLNLNNISADPPHDFHDKSGVIEMDSSIQALVREAMILANN